MELMHHRQLENRTAAIAIVVVAMLFPAASGAAEAEEVTAAAFARAQGLSYSDLSTGSLHACKISGGGFEIILSAGLTNALVNGRPRPLSCPVRWNGTDIVLTQRDAEALASIIGRPLVAPPAPRPLRPVVSKRFKVVIDPGHGGKDPGATYGRLAEKDITLDIALRVASALRSQGVEVVMTRTRDEYVDLDERVSIANRSGPDFFISIHANAIARNAHSVSGAMTIYPPRGARGDKPSIEGRATVAFMENEVRPASFGAAGAVSKGAMLAVTRTAFESYRWMSKSAATEIQRRLSPVVGTVETNEGILEDWRGLRVLSRIQSPAVLVEVDYLSNPSRARKLATSAYRASIADALADAVMAFLRRNAGG